MYKDNSNVKVGNREIQIKMVYNLGFHATHGWSLISSCFIFWSTFSLKIALFWFLLLHITSSPVAKKEQQLLESSVSWIHPPLDGNCWAFPQHCRNMYSSNNPLQADCSSLPSWHSLFAATWRLAAKQFSSWQYLHKTHILKWNMQFKGRKAGIHSSCKWGHGFLTGHTVQLSCHKQGIIN